MRRVVPGVLALMLAVLALVTVPPTHAGGPVRILVYGDSISQGSTGDWTWRYFVDRHLRTSGTAFDFVGPYSGIHHIPEANGTLNTEDWAYADPAFDTDSAAAWGQPLTFPIDDLANPAHSSDLVRKFAPSVVVALIGLNDLGGYFNQTPEHLADVWREKIAAAREVDPGIDFVLVQVPHVWAGGVSAYNQQLLRLSDDLDQRDEFGHPSLSRVVTTDLAQFDRSLDTWDDTHPTASGEVKIAQVVENGLARIGIGRTAGRMPVVANGPTRAASLQVEPGVGQVTLSWDAIPGVTRQWLEERDATAGEPWMRFASGFGPQTRTFTDTGLIDGHRYEYRLRPAKGTAVSAVLTSPVVTEIPGPRPAAPDVRMVSVDAGGNASLSWPGVANAGSYVLSVRDLSGQEPWGPDATTDQTRWTLAGLRSGHTYEMRARADNGLIRGGTSQAVRVVVPVVGAVTKAKVRSTRKDRIRTVAAPVRFATGYRLMVAKARSCRKAPGSTAFRAVGGVRTQRSVALRITSRAVWVRWYAVRDGVAGQVARSSTSCAPVK